MKKVIIDIDIIECLQNEYVGIQGNSFVHSLTVADKETHQIWDLENPNFLDKTKDRFDLRWANRV